MTEYRGRERAIPCRGATLQESIRGTHKTWADDGFCDRCRVLNAQAVLAVRADLTRRSLAASAGTDSSQGSVPASSSSSSAADRSAPAAPLATPQVQG